MKSLLLIFMVLCASLVARAETHVEVYPLNADFRMERDDSQNYTQRTPMGAGFGVSWGQWAVVGEFNRFTETTNNGYSSLDHQHQEEVAWLRRDFSFGRGYQNFFYGAEASLGLMQDMVALQLGGTNSQEHSGSDLLGGVGIEAGVLIEKTLRLSLEGRLIFSSNLDPSPQPDLALRAGFVF